MDVFVQLQKVNKENMRDLSKIMQFRTGSTFRIETKTSVITIIVEEKEASTYEALQSLNDVLKVIDSYKDKMARNAYDD